MNARKLLLVVALSSAVPLLLVVLLKKYVLAPAVVTGVAAALPAPRPLPVANLPVTAAAVPPVQPGLPVPPPPPVVWMTGYIVRGSRFNATLTDGRVVTETDGAVLLARNRLVMSDGVTYWLRNPGHGAPSPSSGL